jgi:hypothetical protein
MRDEEVEDLAGLESSKARQYANAEERDEEQLLLMKVDAEDPVAAGTVQLAASV